jgi:hypothetical protein
LCSPSLLDLLSVAKMLDRYFLNSSIASIKIYRWIIILYKVEKRNENLREYLHAFLRPSWMWFACNYKYLSDWKLSQKKVVEI